MLAQARLRPTASIQGAAVPGPRPCPNLEPLGLALAAPTQAVGLGWAWARIIILVVCIVGAFM